MKINDDQDVVENRTESLGEVSVPLRQQISARLMSRLKEKNAGELISSLWTLGNADRTHWLERQDEYLTQYDNFIDPIYEGAEDWNSTLHLPTIYTVVKTFHARMYSALMGIDPPFTTKSRTGANVERAKLVEDLMRYAVIDWANEYLGVQEQVDRWLWDWVASGVGILKARWDRQYTKFEDIAEVQVPTTTLQVDPETGDNIVVPGVRTEEEIIMQTIERFNGPCVERVNVEDLLIIGGEGDPQKADFVIQQQYVTASTLWSLVDQKVFDRDAVEAVIEAGESLQETDVTGQTKAQRFDNAGLEGPDRTYDLDRYQILEAYIKMDTDGDGIDEDIIVWVDGKTREILRATYLYRVMNTGMRPFFKIDFHKRQGSEYGAGLVELLYSLGQEIDAQHNMRVDVGILTSMPWGFYQASAGTPAEKLPIEPGTLVPMDNPGQNVFFPNLGNRTSFGMQEEAALNQQIERMTSISDLSLGIIGGQGATRTATGTRALVGEANANLDIFVQRMNRGWKQFLKYLFAMLQTNIQPGFQFRILGDDGNDYWQQIESREEIAGLYDFELEANSSNSNPTIRFQSANQIYQMTQNPLDMQLGLVSPLERYEAIKNVLQELGVRDVSRYVRKPADIPRIFTPLEVANRLLSGIDVPLDPTQDLQGFIQWVDGMMSDDELLGQFGQGEVAALVNKQQEAQQLMAAMSQAGRQADNLNQQATNTTAAQTPGNLNVNVLAKQGPLGE